MGYFPPLPQAQTLDLGRSAQLFLRSKQQKFERDQSERAGERAERKEEREEIKYENALDKYKKEEARTSVENAQEDTDRLRKIQTESQKNNKDALNAIGEESQDYLLRNFPPDEPGQKPGTYSQAQTDVLHNASDYFTKRMAGANLYNDDGTSRQLTPEQIRESAKAGMLKFNKTALQQAQIKAGYGVKKEKTPAEIEAEAAARARGTAGEKTPTTAMAAFLEQKPDATPAEIVAFSQQLKGKGMKVTLPDGTVMEIGGGASDTTLKTKGMLEAKLLGAKEQKTRMEGVLSTYKPEYLEFAPRLGIAWDELSEKAGGKLSVNEKKNMTEFHTFKRRASENINLYIKEITGAQMSEAEANRLKLAVPDPGDSWWKGDSPTEFKAKGDDVMLYANAAEARFQWYLSKGMSNEEIITLINTDAAKPLDAIVDAMRE